MQKYGFMGIPFAKEYGGQGAVIPLTYAICVRGIVRVCGTTGVIVSAHTSLGAEPINKFGTPGRKEKYLIPLAKGEKLGARRPNPAQARTLPASRPKRCWKATH